MTKNTLYLLGILATIVIGTLLYLNLCNECLLASSSEVVGPSMEVGSAPDSKTEFTSYPFTIDTDGLQFNTQDNFNFNVSTPSFLLPISSNLKEGVIQLKDFLNQNPEKSLSITGFYTSDETNTTAFPNLGLARANSVKNHLVINEIASSQIDTYGALKDEMVPDSTVYMGPVLFNVTEKAADSDDKLSELYEKITSDPLILYFNTGEAAINLSTEQRLKIAAISRYLDKVPDAMCTIVGHTDNTGNRETNISLGLERAEFAKTYLISNGISGEKIDVSSKGPDSPIAPNNTEDGRSKNRRTVVTLK